MTRLFNTALLGMVVLASSVQADDAARDAHENLGKISHVTLYRDRALVTRDILLPPGEARRSITVPDLPHGVVHNSVNADGVGGTVVRATRVSPRPATKPSSQDMERWALQARELSRQRAETQLALDVVARDLEALHQMIDFSAAAGKTDLERGVLDADALTKLNTFSMTQRRKLSDEQFRQQTQLHDLDQQLEKTKAEQSRSYAGLGSHNYQAIIFVETPDGAAGAVRLNYLVTGCGWSPQYTVRGRSDAGQVELRYGAMVRQTSGEDWESVELILSTASPAVSAARPLLTPLEVNAVEPSNSQAKKQQAMDEDPFAAADYAELATDEPPLSLTEMVQALRIQQQQTEASLENEQFGPSSEQRDLALNALAGQMQHIELLAAARSWRNLAPDVRNDVASQVYTLPQPISLDSRNEQRLVQILELKLDGDVYHVATPLLSTYAYREIETTNTQPVGLIGGPATIFLDNRFVGRMQIPPTASGQRLTIGFGADQQVRTRRELMDKQEVVQGGNRQVTFVYRLVVSNFSQNAISVRLIDRMPHTRQTQQLSVKLTEPAETLSDDALYQRVLRPTGILRWDLTVPSGRHGSDAFDVDFSYTMEFDRSRIPTTEDSFAELKAQYENILMPSGMGGFGGAGFGGR